jgi:hypothetical protein
MSSSAFCKVAASLFGIVALAHVARLASDVSVQIGTTTIPKWVSWLGVLVAGGLSVWGFRSK